MGVGWDRWGTFGTRLAPASRTLSAIRTLTRGLGISESPTSDYLTPQEATKQDVRERGADGVDLSCPGSSVVAETRTDGDDTEKI
jgi:hypothetical protein